MNGDGAGYERNGEGAGAEINGEGVGAEINGDGVVIAAGELNGAANVDI
jgi:hypothetical protein